MAFYQNCLQATTRQGYLQDTVSLAAICARCNRAEYCLIQRFRCLQLQLSDVLYCRAWGESAYIKEANGSNPRSFCFGGSLGSISNTAWTLWRYCDICELIPCLKRIDYCYQWILKSTFRKHFELIFNRPFWKVIFFVLVLHIAKEAEEMLSEMKNVYFQTHRSF